MCQLCTVTVIAGLGISRMLGIDDMVAALWIGGLILSLTFVTLDWLDKWKWIKKKLPKLDIKRYTIPAIILMYTLVLLPLKLNGSIGIAGNTLLGIDKIIFGVVIGSAMFLLGTGADKLQRRKFKKIFFPYQKVVFPITLLLITSLIMWLVTK